MPTPIASNIIMARLDLRGKKGDTFDTYLDFLDDQSIAMSFAGCSIKCEIRQGAPDGKVLQMFCTQQSTLIVQANRVSFNAILVAEAGPHYYDLQVTYQSGTVKTLVGGKFIVVQDTTH